MGQFFYTLERRQNDVENLMLLNKCKIFDVFPKSIKIQHPKFKIQFS